MRHPARWFVFLCLLTLLALAPFAATAEEAEAPEAQPAYEPRTLAPSWRDQATAAYGEKRYADAIFLYRKWLEADPHDDGSWYNLACTYALAGMKAAALEAFETAVDAGWEDPRWPTEDTDLAPIREDPRFDAAVARCAANQGKNAPQDAVRHWVEIPAVTTYLAMLPPDYESTEKAYPLVLILHGNGSSEAWHGRLADRAGRDGVIYVAPRAPYPNAQVFYQLAPAGLDLAAPGHRRGIDRAARRGAALRRLDLRGRRGRDSGATAWPGTRSTCSATAWAASSPTWRPSSTRRRSRRPSRTRAGSTSTTTTRSGSSPSRRTV